MKGLPETLGAAMYVPALHKDAVGVLQGTKVPGLRTVVLCTEDSLREDEVELALQRLGGLLEHVGRGPDVYLRPRNDEVLARVLAEPQSRVLRGLVLPKVTVENFAATWRLLESRPDLDLMLTLESRDALEADRMRALRSILNDPGIHARIRALRIGGNDLMGLMGLRRPKGCTLYDTPMAWVMGQLVGIFAPDGFALTAPVFELLDQPELLERELAMDLNYGMVGKTAIHPDQVARIDAAFRVCPRELGSAREILCPEAAAVFRRDGAMCETTTHRNWARRTVERADRFGLRL